MNLIAETLLYYWTLSRKTRKTPSGWIAADAVCCDDHRGRGGLILNPAGAVSYSCFNCGFKASWHPGRTVSLRMRRFMRLIGIDDTTILKLSLAALKFTETQTTESIQPFPVFSIKSLPDQAKPIESYIDGIPEKLKPILTYMASRKLYLEDYPFYWSPLTKYCDRLIIPFFYHGAVVGHTSRTIDPTNKIRYLSDQQPGYVFNLDRQRSDRKFVLVCEGSLDAISIDGTALLGSEINTQQHQLLSQLNREIVLIPDRDANGLRTLEHAISREWSVSMPDWPSGIKDVNDAVCQLGRLATLWSIIDAKESSEFKIRLQSKRWFRHI